MTGMQFKFWALPTTH